MAETKSERLDRLVEFLRTDGRVPGFLRWQCDAITLASEIETLQRQNAIYWEALEALRIGQPYCGYWGSLRISAEALRLADAVREAGKDGDA